MKMWFSLVFAGIFESRILEVCTDSLYEHCEVSFYLPSGHMFPESKS